MILRNKIPFCSNYLVESKVWERQNSIPPNWIVAIWPKGPLINDVKLKCESIILCPLVSGYRSVSCFFHRLINTPRFMSCRANSLITLGMQFKFVLKLGERTRNKYCKIFYDIVSVILSHLLWNNSSPKKIIPGTKNEFANNSIAQIRKIPQVILVNKLREKNPAFNSRVNILVIKLREKNPAFNSRVNILVIELREKVIKPVIN